MGTTLGNRNKNNRLCLVIKLNFSFLSLEYYFPVEMLSTFCDSILTDRQIQAVLDIFLLILFSIYCKEIQLQRHGLLFLAKEPPEPICKAKIDVGFILDSSGSLRNDYQREKDFMKVLASSFGISPDGSRAGVVTFSYNAEHSIKLNDHDDLMAFNKAVDEIPLMGSITRIDKALRLSQRELFSLSNGARPGIPKILVLLTDGSQTADADAVDPGDIADEIRDQGIKVLVIGIGAGVNQTELLHLGGGQANTFSAASFDELVSSSFIKKVVEKKCEVGKLVHPIALVLPLVCPSVKPPIR